MSAPRDKNRRAKPRVKLRGLLSYADFRSDRRYNILGVARTQDLSETGLRIVTHESLPLGRELNFELKLGGALHRFRGRIVWGAELEKERSYEFGVRFRAIDFSFARELFELTCSHSGNTPDEPIALARVEPRSAESPPVGIFALAGALFHVLSNKPLALERPELDLLQHLAGGVLPAGFDSGDPAAVSAAVTELLVKVFAQDGKAVSHAPVAEQRDALARALGNLAPPAEGSAAPVGGSPRRADSAPAAPLSPPRSTRTRPPSGSATRQGRATPAPKPGAMSGHFEGDELVELVQMLGMNSKTGIVRVSSDVGESHLAFREGRIVAARTREGGHGESAVHEILATAAGEFDFRPDLLASVLLEHDFPVQGILLEAFRRRDESRGKDEASGQEQTEA